MSKSEKGPYCPSCRRPATGNFCQHCGAELGGRFCNECGAEIAAGAAFCNQCGTKTPGGAGRRRPPAAGVPLARSNLPWWAAGVAMFAAIFVLGVSMVNQPSPVAPAGGGVAPVGGGGGAGAIDLSTMSPIEAADRLFNRVMQSVSDGDSAQAQAFLPMAIAAYERARPLSLDGLFHLSMLNRTAFELDAALAIAMELLGQDPNHLLGLAAAAEASVEMDRPEEAAVYYRRLVDAYDAEMARALPEYDMHSGIVGTLKTDAEAFLAGR